MDNPEFAGDLHRDDLGVDESDTSGNLYEPDQGKEGDRIHPMHERDEERLASEQDATIGADELEIARIEQARVDAGLPLREPEVDVDQDDYIDDGDQRHSDDIGGGTVDPKAYAEVLSELELVVEEREKYLRALSDCENRRRREQEQARQQVGRANERFLEELLPVLSSFDRAFAAAETGASLESLQQGLSLVQRQLNGFLQAIGAQVIEPEVGGQFDPAVHEAMMRQAVDGIDEGHVSAVLERGIILNGRCVRPARVAVAGPALDVEA